LSATEIELRDDTTIICRAVAYLMVQVLKHYSLNSLSKTPDLCFTLIYV